MRFLFLINDALTLYNFRLEFLDLLAGRGDEVAVSVPKGPYCDALAGHGCRILPTALSARGMNPFRDGLLPLTYARLIRAERPDVVLTYTIKPNIYGGLAAGLCGVPCVSTVTGLGSAFEKGRLVRAVACALYRIGTRRTARLFFQNPAHDRLFADRGIAVGRHLVVAGSGVNLRRHAFEPYPEGDGVDFLFVGRVTRDKGIGELVDAMRAVRRTRPDATLGLLGTVEPDCGDMVRAAEREGLLVSHGRHENVHDYVARCGAVVLPSYHEGMANALLEASAAGRPVVASRIPGCMEAFDEGVTGFGCRPRDAGDLAAAMLRFAGLPRERRAEMGLAARRKMELEFDRDAVNATYLSVIDELVSERTKS